MHLEHCECSSPLRVASSVPAAGWRRSHTRLTTQTRQRRITPTVSFEDRARCLRANQRGEYPSWYSTQDAASRDAAQSCSTPPAPALWLRLLSNDQSP